MDPYWNTVAGTWDDWGPPLRPGVGDINAYCRLLRRWGGQKRTEIQALMFGVTPELAQAHWPLPLVLTAVDLSQAMIDRVWPGDIPDRRRALRADWMHFRPESTPDLILTDGAPVFFRDPRVLFARVRELLEPDGAFLCRAFCAPERHEPLETVLDDARAGRIENFHVLKWRVAMSLQHEPTIGVTQDAVWRAIVAARLDYARLPQPGFSAAAAATLRFYEGATATLHFPTQVACTAGLRSVFGEVWVERPDAVFGDCCPVFLAAGAA